MSWHYARDREVFAIEVCDGKLDVPFVPGDTVVFTQQFMVKFPGQIDQGNLAEVAVYWLHELGVPE